MKLYTFIVHYLHMCMKEYGCCPKFQRRNNSTYTFTKRRGHVPCKRNSSYTTHWTFMTLYTFVVHYLQMCMKEYGCCPKFNMRDNSTYTFTKRGACTFLAQLFLNDLLDLYETLHICSTLPTHVHEEIWLLSKI